MWNYMLFIFLFKSLIFSSPYWSKSTFEVNACFAGRNTMGSNSKCSALKFHAKILIILNNPFAVDNVFHFDVFIYIWMNSVWASE